MNRLLPLLAQRATATARCTYCPKLCRPACPVSTVTARETLTPWGKMRAMDELLREVDPGGERDRARAAWGCTACGHCRELCLLDNPVADTLWDGRADALANGTAPAAAQRVVAEFPARLDALASRAKALPHLGDVPAGDGTTVYLPGCTAVTFEPETVHRGARAVASLVPGGCSVLAAECCGAPLLDAGDREGFVAHARRFAERLDHVERVVTSDAGCAFTLRRSYARVGVALRNNPRVEHVAELAARHVERLQPIDEPREVIHHDSCRLGRGLGVYEEPRAVLRAILGRDATEMPTVRARAACSGGGGLLPAVMPEAAAAIGRELAGEAKEVSGERPSVVVTSCAASRRQLRVAGVEAEDLAAFIARSLE